MKFYEYPSNSDTYYALLLANSEQEANELYNAKIGDIDTVNYHPKVISWIKAWWKIRSTCKTASDKSAAMGLLTQNIADGKSFVALLDVDLT